LDGRLGGQCRVGLVTGIGEREIPLDVRDEVGERTVREGFRRVLLVGAIGRVIIVRGVGGLGAVGF
jgi:hypothetical protein